MIENRRFAQRRVTDGSRLVPLTMVPSTVAIGPDGHERQALRGLRALSKNSLIRSLVALSGSGASPPALRRSDGSEAAAREARPEAARPPRPAATAGPAGRSTTAYHAVRRTTP